MRDTGIVRRVDELGRIVIPMELRRTLGINVKDPIAIYTEGDRIILEKSTDSCALCGSETDVTTVKDRARLRQVRRGHQEALAARRGARPAVRLARRLARPPRRRRPCGAGRAARRRAPRPPSS